MPSGYCSRCLIDKCVLIWLDIQRTPKCPAQQVNPGQPTVHNEHSDVFADPMVEEFLQVCDYMSKIPGMSISFEHSFIRTVGTTLRTML